MGTVAWTRGDGPLVPFAGGYGRKLFGLGHKPGVVKHYLGPMGQLSRWLACEGPPGAAAVSVSEADRRGRSRRRHAAGCDVAGYAAPADHECCRCRCRSREL